MPVSFRLQKKINTGKEERVESEEMRVLYALSSKP